MPESHYGPFNFDKQHNQAIAMLGHLAPIDATHVAGRALGQGRVLISAEQRPPKIVYEHQELAEFEGHPTRDTHTYTFGVIVDNGSRVVRVTQTDEIQEREDGRPVQRWTGKEPRVLSGARRDIAIQRMVQALTTLSEVEVTIPHF
jgi:hypothetical protein